MPVPPAAVPPAAVPPATGAPEVDARPVQDKVREFHETFSLAVGEAPTLDKDCQQLRIALLAEEFNEYLTAEDDADLVEVADALADIVYIAYGTAISYGIDLDAVLGEVHRSNMSKVGRDGRPVYRADGKVLKGPDYFPPDVAGHLTAPST